jgi:hypothetical protein
MDFTGKPLSGYVYVALPLVRTAASLKSWVEQGLKFARTLPPKGEVRLAGASPSATGKPPAPSPPKLPMMG